MKNYSLKSYSFQLTHEEYNEILKSFDHTFEIYQKLHWPDWFKKRYFFYTDRLRVYIGNKSKDKGQEINSHYYSPKNDLEILPNYYIIKKPNNDGVMIINGKDFESLNENIRMLTELTTV